MNRSRSLILSIAMVCVISVGLVSAQMAPPGGGGRPTPGGRPTQGTPRVPNGSGQIQVTPPAMSSGVPMMPSSVPTISLTGLPPASDVATSAIVSFGQQYLGLNTAPLYAGQVDTSQINTVRGGSQVDTSAQLAQLTAQLPAEVQAILEAASGSGGIPYWAVYSDGGAILYADASCTGANCTVNMQSVQVAIDSASLGAYFAYRTATIASQNDALALITSVYPALANYPSTSVSTSTGYAFTATSTNLQSGLITAYFFGAVPVQNYTLVYATVGVGSAYSDLVINR